MKQPKIRFKGFSGEWETRTLGSLGNVAMCKRIFKDQTSNSGDIPFYKIGTFGSKPDAFISRELYLEYKSRFNFPQKGDILISAAGTIGRTVEYLGEEAYYQDSNIVWLNHNNEIENPFLKQLYSVISWKGLEGATIKRLYNNIFLETEIKLPSIKEQQTIANYFQHLDSLIQSTTKKIDSLKQVKAASLQSMFPQEGETTPRVRFKGFKGEWIKDTLGNIAQILKGEQINKNKLSSHGTYYVLNGGVEPSGYTENYNTKSGTISISEGGNSCGYVSYNNLNFWSGGHNYTLQNVNIDNKFLYAYLKGREHDIMSKRVGSGLPNIQKKSLQDFIVFFPFNGDEQHLLGLFFFSLDTQISLHSQRLEKLKQIKSACLDNMFV